MPEAPRITAAAQKRALASIQSDLRRLNIIKTNQARLVSQIQQLIARYNQADTLATTLKKKVDDSVAQLAKKVG